jgi:hypothetical protein
MAANDVMMTVLAKCSSKTLSRHQYSEVNVDHSSGTSQAKECRTLQTRWNGRWWIAMLMLFCICSVQ